MKKNFRNLLFILATFVTTSIYSEPLFILTIPKAGTCLTRKAVGMLTDSNIEGLNHLLFSEDEHFLENNPQIKTSVNLVPHFESLRKCSEVKKNSSYSGPKRYLCFFSILAKKK